MSFKERPVTINSMYSKESLYLFYVGFLETYMIRYPDDTLYIVLKEFHKHGVKIKTNG